LAPRDDPPASPEGEADGGQARGWGEAEMWREMQEKLDFEADILWWCIGRRREFPNGFED
jgi:hypothetical protein